MVDKIWYNMEELIGGSEERGINRNILECKVIQRPPVLPLLQVLIETYWNVKGSWWNRLSDASVVLIETYWNVKKYTQTADLGYIPY